MSDIDHSAFAAHYKRRNQMKLAAALQPNGTLKNKLGIKDPAKLAHVEYIHSAKRMNAILKQHKPINSIDQLKVIHKHMFGGIYSWAGKVRDYDISKNGHKFLPHAAMNMAGYNINMTLRGINAKKRPTRKDYGKLLDVVNNMHPFREGNGRSTKCFLEDIAIQHGQFLQYDRHEEDAIKGLDAGNPSRIAKHIHIQKLGSPVDLMVSLSDQKDHAIKLANEKYHEQKAKERSAKEKSHSASQSKADDILKNFSFNKVDQAVNKGRASHKGIVHHKKEIRSKASRGRKQRAKEARTQRKGPSRDTGQTLE